MEKLFSWFSVIISIIGGFIANLLGGFDAVIISLVTLVVLDYITGLIKAIASKRLSSEIGFKGLLKKILLFIVVAVSVVIQDLIGDTIPLREIVIMFYIANEGISLLENVAEFIPLPKKLKDVLIQLRENVTKEN